MKKISKINIVDRTANMKWYIKLLIVILSGLLVLMAVILVRFYLDVNNKNDQMLLSQGIIKEANIEKNDYKLFRDDNGKFGIMDSDECQIIEPQWDNIYLLNSNRFVVQMNFNETVKMGIIDSDENHISPFVYGKFQSIGDEFIAGYFSDEDGFSLFDTSGNILLYEKWIDYKYCDDSITLMNEYGEFIYINDSGMLSCKEIDLNRSTGNFNVKMCIDSERIINELTIKKLNSIFDISCVYVDFLTSEEVDIKNITNDKYFSSLASNNFFEKCEVQSIGDFKIRNSADLENSYVVSTEILYDYIGEGKRISNLKSLLSMTIVEEDGRLILKSINKEEL